MLYIGSCRYMYDYDWNFFPARLHTTREIIFFLENITNIHHIIENNPSNLTNLIFGDIYHPGVINDSKQFMNNKIDKHISKIIMEISSRKVMYYKGIPLNYFYSLIHADTVSKYKLIEKKLSDEEIDDDLNCIVKMCKTIFNEDIEIHIITHLNLKTKTTLNYIFERNSLVTLLERLGNKNNIKVHNVGKYIENHNNECFLEDYMPDSTHYSMGYDIIKRFLINEIMKMG